MTFSLVVLCIEASRQLVAVMGNLIISQLVYFSFSKLNAHDTYSPYNLLES